MASICIVGKENLGLDSHKIVLTHELNSLHRKYRDLLI